MPTTYTTMNVDIFRVSRVARNFSAIEWNEGLRATTDWGVKACADRRVSVLDEMLRDHTLFTLVPILRLPVLHSLHVKKFCGRYTRPHCKAGLPRDPLCYSCRRADRFHRDFPAVVFELVATSSDGTSIVSTSSRMKLKPRLSFLIVLQRNSFPLMIRSNARSFSASAIDSVDAASVSARRIV